MSFHRWINTLLSYLFRARFAREADAAAQWLSPGLERLEDRLPPAAGLTGGNQQLLSAYGNYR